MMLHHGKRFPTRRVSRMATNLQGMPAAEPPAAKNHKIEVGQRLRHSRLVLDLKLKPTAELCGTTHPVWLGWEKGRSYPAPWVMLKYCQMHGVSFDYLYRGQMTGLVGEVAERLRAVVPASQEDVMAAADQVAKTRS